MTFIFLKLFVDENEEDEIAWVACAAIYSSDWGQPDNFTFQLLLSTWCYWYGGWVVRNERYDPPPSHVLMFPQVVGILGFIDTVFTIEDRVVIHSYLVHYIT